MSPERPCLAAAGRRALACLAWWHIVAAHADRPLPQPAGDTSLTPAVVAVTVNGTARGDFFVHRTASGRILLRRQDLPALGLAVTLPTAGVIDGSEHVALESHERIELRLDEPTLTLTLNADPRLLNRHVLGSTPGASRGERLAGEGAFLNWAIEQSLSDGSPQPPASLALEAGTWLGPALFLHRGQTFTNSQGHRRLARLATSLSHDQPERLLRWTAGDLAALSDELGQGVLLGGLSVATLTRLDPYRIRHPLGAVQGQALMPSEVEVYVDGQRVRTERVPAGVFEIRDLATPLGARAVQLLVRDPYGRVQRFDQSLYVSQRLLAPGLHDFQYAIGGLRRDTGQGSPRYGPAAFTARHAWGASDGLTLGLHAQGREGQLAGGGSMVLQVADRGLLSAHVASSRVGGVRGHAGLLRHEYQSARWGLGTSVRADSPGYTALGNAPGPGSLRRELQAYVSRALEEGRSVWASHSRQSFHPAQRITVPQGWPDVPGQPRHATTFGYSAWLRPWGASLRVSASRLTQGLQTRHEWGVSLVFQLDRGGLWSAQNRQGPEGAVQSVQWSQPPPPQGGWGHDISASWQSGFPGGPSHWQAASQLEADAVRLRAETAGGAGPDSLRLSAAGGLSRLGGQWHHSRPVDASFVLVQVDGLSGVPVTVNGLHAGVTDARGQRLVTQVGAHHETNVEIDPQAVPIDRRLKQVHRRVVLPERGGAVIRFEARPLRALMAQLVARSGQGLQPVSQARIRIGDGPQALESFTGLQGELYLEDLAPGLHAGQAEGASGPCRFQLDVPAHAAPLTDLGTLACTPAAPTQNRSEGPR